MWSYLDRKIQIHVFTLDQVLATDVQDRIAFDPRTRDYVLARPRERSIKAAVEEIEGMARQSVSSSLLIMDVRSHTLPRLQHAYNKVVGYNRTDLNELCYVILIGDGPFNLFHAGKSLHVFRPRLAAHRIDYSPAVFFYDPFLHYTEEDGPVAGIDRGDELPQLVPKRLERAFKGGGATLVQAREYFRAASLSGPKRQAAMQRRQERLARFYRKRIAEEFPHHKDQLEAWLSKDGFSLSGEILRLHLYPLFFEDWVFGLMEKARRRRG